MEAKLGNNRYGKGRVNVAKIIRNDAGDHYRNATVDVLLEGDFDEAFLSGDNRKVVPTDTMKNTVWVFAAKYWDSSIEDYGKALARHFVDDFEHVTKADILLEEHLWRRVRIHNRPEPYSFVGAGPELKVATVRVTGEDMTIRSGFSGLPILKTRGSAFEDFMRDKYTTLWEAPERMLATEVNTTWLYAETTVDFEGIWEDVRRIIIETFVKKESRSVQHSLHAMGTAVLDTHEEISEITLSLPNKHHFEVDLRPFGIKSGEVLFPVTNPHGMIEATIQRP